VVAVALGACLALAPAAGAATVTAPPPDEDGHTSVGIDHADEINHLVLTEREDGRVLVMEQGEAPLDAAGACEQQTERRVVCPPRAAGFFLELGDGADRAILNLRSGPVVKVEGGDEPDEIAVNHVGRYAQVWVRGGRGGDTLLGSERRDRLYGGAGRDTVSGRGGDDILMGDGGHSSAGHDLISGGPGFDSAGWSDRRVPVTVDLRGAASGGTDGEDDVLKSIEAATGGEAGDVLIGDGGPNFLRGGPGPDSLRGRGDSDRLEGGTGPDELSAGDGDDVLDGGKTEENQRTDGAVDRLSCADRNDVVLRATGDGARTDPIPQSCERVLAVFNLAVPRLRLGAERVMVEVVCQGPGGERRVRLVSRGSELGHSDTVTNCDHHPREVEVPLAEPLAPGPPIRVVIEGQDQSFGPPQPFHVSYRLIRPRG
jgi:hypothetical protein